MPQPEFLALVEELLDEVLGLGPLEPLLADQSVNDILVNFDDQRAGATLKVLSELAQQTQIILFTHHQRVIEIAKAEFPVKPVLQSVLAQNYWSYYQQNTNDSR